MGNSSSSTSNDAKALEAFYSAAVGKHLKVGGAVSGGYASLEDYGNSLYSEGKEKLIRAIAKDVSSALKISGDFAQTAKIADVVSRLQRSVPDPKKGQKIKSDDKVHTELCKALAKSINKNAGSDIIDVNATNSQICNKVGEFMYSLFTGLHSEFLSVSGDVSRIITNLKVLQEVVDAANKKIINQLAESDQSSSMEAGHIKELYDAVSKEISRQQEILSNLVGASIGPIGNSLLTILEDNDDFKGLVKELSDMSGTTDFSAKLSYILNGSANVAHTAELVDKALKEIGMSVKDYKAASNLTELQTKIYHMISAKHPSSGELEKLIIAMNIVSRNDFAHEDIAKYLESKKGGFVGAAQGGASLDITTADDSDIRTALADENNPFKGRTQSTRKSITKQLNQKEQLRKQLFAVLNSQLKDQYNKFKFVLGTIGKKLGGEIELSLDLELFIRQLQNFSDSQPDRKDIHIALSGYRKDLGTTWVKHQYMENLYAISEAAAKLADTKNGKYFSELKSVVDGIINVVLEFNKNFTGALTAITVKSLADKKKSIFGAADGGAADGGAAEGGDADGGAAEGGDCACGGDPDEDDIDEMNETELTNELDESVLMEGGSFEGELGAIPAELPLWGGDTKADTVINAISALGGVVRYFKDSDFEYFKTIKKSIREVQYFYKIANIKKNMNKVSQEYENNVENYENVLGEEAGYIIDLIQKKYNTLIDALDADSTIEQNALNDLYACGYGRGGAAAETKLRTDLDTVARPLNDADKKTLKSYEDGYKFLLEYIRSSKIEMLEAIQALDLYLSKFTQSMQVDPNQIKDFIQILEQIEIVAKFFSDKSGDQLVGVFEAFTSNIRIPVAPATPEQADAGGESIEINNWAGLSGRNSANIRNSLDSDSFATTGDHYYTMLTAANGPGRFYRPRMLTRDRAVNFVKQIEKAVKSVRSLENTINTFSKVNTEVSGSVQTFMSAGYIFKAFMKYAIASSISVGNVKLDNNSIINLNLAAGAVEDAHNKLYRKMSVCLRTSNDLGYGYAGENIRFLDPLFIKRIGITNDLDTYKDVCDDLFSMAVKSMITKIFTVVGSYTLFNRPAKLSDTNPLDKPINPLRQILGGNEGGSIASETEVIPAATELYIRLPLLVEWYRDVFDFKDPSGRQPGDANTNPLISIIPDMDNIWGELCRIIFLEATNIADGAYPSQLANRIIKAINEIYKAHISKSSGMSCNDIIMEFVLEINRRYGFIMREEIQAYFKERYSSITADQQYPDDDNVDYDLVEIEMGMGKRPAPSDRFRTFGRKQHTRKFQLEDFLGFATRFRESIERNLQLPAPVGQADNSSLYGMIMETTKRIDSALTKEEKYRIVHEQLHGIDQYSDVDQQKMILFHETVITPLTTLYTVYAILNDFNKFCVSFGVLKSDDTPAINVQILMERVRDKFKGDSIYKQKQGDNVNNYPFGQIVVDSAFSANAPINTMSYSDFYILGNMQINTLFEHLLRALMNVGCDVNGLTEVNFVKNNNVFYPYIDYSKLEEVCSNLFNDVKTAFNQLRKYVPYQLVERYEKGTDNTGVQQRLSLFYIQEHLIDRLFGNKYGNGLVDANIGIKNIWSFVKTQNPQLSPVFSKLSHWEYSANSLNRKNILTKEFPVGYAPLFQDGSSLFNNSSPSRKAISAVLGNQTVLPAGSGSLVGNVVERPAANNLTSRYFSFSGMYDLDDKIAINHNFYGLIPKLNQLIYKYCNILIDSSSKKIYKTLIDKFVNGAVASNIIDGKNINETNVRVGGPGFSAGNSFITETEPQLGAVLFASIAKALHNLATEQVDKATGSVRVYIEDSLLNVTDIQKEKMRAYLPAFEKEFELLAKKAEFMIECVENSGFDLAEVTARVLPAPLLPIVPGYSQAPKPYTTMTSLERTKYLVNLFETTARAARSMVRCIIDTQKELNDVPMYFESYADSIVDYNNRNGRMPFMPISHITQLYKVNLDALAINATELSIVPTKSAGVGSAEFKFAYGTRGLLNKQKPSMEFAPGVSALLKSYNSKVGGAAAFNEKTMSNVLENVVYLSRWSLDFIYHKQVLDNHDWVNTSRLLDIRAGATVVVSDLRYLSCQVGKNGNDIVRVLETDSVKQPIDDIISCINVNQNLALGDRSTFRKYNILDLNIVPINVHAMQREIPFVNLLNYSYTFDQLMEWFMKNNDSSSDIKWFIGKLKAPLSTQTELSFRTTTYRFMNGSKPNGLGRPKYLSDQLWNKVLLNNLYEIVTSRIEDRALPFTSTVGPKELKYTHGNLLVGSGANINTTEGYYRYNTKLVRWVEWFAQLQRVTRLLMRSQLEWVADPVVHGSDAIAAEVTEYKTKDSTFTLDDYE